MKTFFGFKDKFAYLFGYRQNAKHEMAGPECDGMKDFYCCDLFFFIKIEKFNYKIIF